MVSNQFSNDMLSRQIPYTLALYKLASFMKCLFLEIFKVLSCMVKCPYFQLHTLESESSNGKFTVNVCQIVSQVTDCVLLPHYYA